MTSATIRQTRDASRGEGYWMIVFAATLLGVVGIFNLIDGIAAIANLHIFIANAHYVVGDLRAWGWVALILGALQVLASIAVVVGNQAARWFAVAVIGLNAIGQMFFIPAYPFCRAVGDGWGLKMKSCSRSSGSWPTTMARSTAFSSSRTFPSQGCCCNRFIAAGVTRLMRLFIARENLRTK